MDTKEKICLCRKVTAGDVEQAVRDGATTLEQVQEQTGAATVCGRCKSKLAACLEELLQG